jgi:hypothetical protein
LKRHHRKRRKPLPERCRIVIVDKEGNERTVDPYSTLAHAIRYVDSFNASCQLSSNRAEIRDVAVGIVIVPRPADHTPSGPDESPGYVELHYEDSAETAKAFAVGFNERQIDNPAGKWAVVVGQVIEPQRAKPRRRAIVS